MKTWVKLKITHIGKEMEQLEWSRKQVWQFLNIKHTLLWDPAIPKKMKRHSQNFCADVHRGFIPYSPTWRQHTSPPISGQNRWDIFALDTAETPPSKEKSTAMNSSISKYHSLLASWKKLDTQSDPNQKKLCNQTKQPASIGTRSLYWIQWVSLGGWGLDLVQRGTFWGDGNVILSWTACWLSSWN